MIRSLLCTVTLATLAATSLPARADDFLQQEGDMWRASKLVGVNLYGPDQKKVGAISDVLMGKDGKVGYVVVGIGGFLGIGEKDVAIPYDKVTFTQDPLSGAGAGMTTAPGNAAAPGAAPANTGMAPNSSAGLGTPATTNGAGTGAVPSPANNATATNDASAAAPTRSATYPDHGTIDYSADQLKAAPTFTYGK